MNPERRSGAVALGITRTAVGLLFMEHGIQKLFGGMGGLGAPGKTADLMTLLGVAGILEFFGGLLLALGAFTRPVAAILIAEMVTAFFIGHFPRGGWPVQNEGELALLYAAVFVTLATLGGGAFSVDRALRARRE
jgi:putative oxidoreductase